MKKALHVLMGAAFALLFSSTALAHFAMVIPSDDIVSQGEPRELSLNIMFIHPFEGTRMDMARPAAFGVAAHGERQDLLDTLKEVKADGMRAWEARYEVEWPGDHVFYLDPAPYFEPAEGKFIVHYTKVIVGAFGMQDSWDGELGRKAEIVPLTRPYGLWTGNVFQGVVKVDGKPVPDVLVEVEYFNEGGRVKAPSDEFVTQVIKADGRGVFTYAMPREGWWGFAALTEGKERIRHTDGREYPVETGAVIWVRTHDME